MGLHFVTLFLAASLAAIEAVPLPDHGTTIESREEFRARTRKVFKRTQHKSFTDSGFTADESNTVKLSVFFDEGKQQYYLKEGVSTEHDDSLAKAVFVDGADATGWGRLSVIGSRHAASQSENGQGHVFYGAGYLEGYLTCEYIAKFFKNYYVNTFSGSPPSAEIVDFVEKNDKWVQAQVAANSQSSAYWRQVGAVQRQFAGLVDGYNARCGSTHGEMTSLQFKLLNMNGDLFDIKAKFPSKEDEAKNAMVEEEAGDRFIPTHCSALIKLTPDFSDVFVGHATWDTYSNVYPRIFKHLSLPVFREEAPAQAGVAPRLVQEQHRVHYSSMPGYLASVDDFYVTKGTSDMSVIETSISLYNKTLLDRVVPETMLCWQRVVVANALAHDGAEWTSIFAQHNSGTYNNEWMVTDFRKFNPGSDPSPGFFYVLNQLPGEVVTKDMTEHIARELYFGSYNVPIHERAWELAGYGAQSAKSTDPAQFSYYECPRALQFAKLHGDVMTDADMGWIIGWNDIPSSADEERMQLSRFYDNDASNDYFDEDYPFSPSNAIAARYDLVGAPENARGLAANRMRRNEDKKEEKPMAYGGIDGKVASYTSVMLETPVQWARAGPTYDEQPVFCWEGELAKNTVHEAHPECYQWEWQPMHAHDIFYA